LQGKQKNVIAIVFDAFSAYDISLYGFPRETTPNINRLAKRAVVYHNHFAGGNFTTPGTGALLTGVLPWTHRAFNHNQKVADPFVKNNIFSAFQDYYRISYTHNGFANTLLKQFQEYIDEPIAREAFFLESADTLISSIFKNDDDIASISWLRSMRLQENGGYAYSLLLSHLYESIQEKRIQNLKQHFPRGIPTTGADYGYLLETAIEEVGKRLSEIPQPFFGYFHFMPPHQPYRTPREFFNAFKDDSFKDMEKPLDILVRKEVKNLPIKRREYDEFILYCDREFGRFYGQLESSGLLENTWLVLTSDHGEMFERGFAGHGSKLLHQPVVRIPLLIFEPGGETGIDIHEYTSAVDVLPTLSHVTRHSTPQWGEGIVMPPYATVQPDSDRNIYVVQAMKNSPNAPLTEASITLTKERYKLHYYFGYPETGKAERVELFDIKSDPDELVDLVTSKSGIAMELLDEVKRKLKEVNEPYL
ncbi:MAG TPA: sulfatase-like hydrolase/transferase, partial [Anaerolineales bacterium]|nr:sulfatase-like hydrolase/transferase [Anaerolineales bacterium]